MLKEKYIYRFNETLPKVQSMTNDELREYIEERFVEIDAARHILEGRTKQIVAHLPKIEDARTEEITVKLLKKAGKNVKRIDFDKLLEEIDWSDAE